MSPFAARERQRRVLLAHRCSARFGDTAPFAFDFGVKTERKVVTLFRADDLPAVVLGVEYERCVNDDVHYRNSSVRHGGTCSGEDLHDCRSRNDSLVEDAVILHPTLDRMRMDWRDNPVRASDDKRRPNPGRRSGWRAFA